jgi:hypothetical protein
LVKYPILVLTFIRNISDILKFVFLHCDMAADSPEKGAGRNGYSSASMLTSSLAGYHLTTDSSLIAINSF